MALTALHLGFRVNLMYCCPCFVGAAVGLGCQLICIVHSSGMQMWQVRPLSQDHNQHMQFVAGLLGIDPQGSLLSWTT